MRSILADFNAPAFWAGITAFVFYAFGAPAVLLAFTGQIGVSPEQFSSWFFVIMGAAALVSIPLTLVYRQPIQIGWTIPGLVYLAAVSGQFSFAEIVGANILTGVLIIAIGLLGVGGRIMGWLPLPIVLGMFAGSILGMMLDLVRVTVEDGLIAGVAVAAYLAGRAVRNPRVPPVGLALVFGGLAVVLLGRLGDAPLAWSWPTLVVPEVQFAPAAFVAISLPMVVLALGLGNVQGLGFLISQGYRVPVDLVTVVTGINSLVHALLGGHTASVARTGIAILAGPDAGPVATRYWSSLVANGLTIFLALAAGVIASLAAILPASYVIALGGLAVLGSFQEALEKAFGQAPLRFGALVAFLVAATPFSLLAIPSPLWALMAGLVGSLVVEREALLAHWQTPAPQPTEPRPSGSGAPGREQRRETAPAPLPHGRGSG